MMQVQNLHKETAVLRPMPGQSGAYSGGFPSPTVLVVEPDTAFRDRLVGWLREAGFCVQDVDSFAAARRVIAQAVPQLIVTELRLGSYNGLHLALVARRISPSTRALVLAAGRDGTLMEEARRCGAEYVLKPIERRTLVAQLTGLLQADIDN
jgi:DNA-binding response OmpR family regulator